MSTHFSTNPYKSVYTTFSSKLKTIELTIYLNYYISVQPSVYFVIPEVLKVEFRPKTIRKYFGINGIGIPNIIVQFPRDLVSW